MGFDKKYFLNDNVLKLLKTGGLDGIRDWMKKADAVIAESGVSSDVLDLLEDYKNLSPEKIQEKTKELIEKAQEEERKKRLGR
tara:strand:+ start:572 stop:820 length:249 start_codon:yes stop_codon:yes gene_type:complete